MRIALTVGSFNLLGGIERVTVQLALSYQALGHDVTVFATDWDPAFEDRFRFVKVVAPARPAWLRTLKLPGAMSRALAGHSFDFIHGQGTSTLTCDLLTFHSVHAAWVAVSIAEELAFSPRRLLKRLYPFHLAAVWMERRQVATHRGPIHACSQEVREEVIRYYGADPDRVVAIPWGIDLEHFKPNAEARARMRAEWGVAPETRVLLLVANEFNRKGLGVLLDAMATLGAPPSPPPPAGTSSLPFGRLAHQGGRKRLSNDPPNPYPSLPPGGGGCPSGREGGEADHKLCLVVAGRGDPAPFQAQLKRLGLQHTVKFLGHVEVAPCYQAADVFVLPSTYEGWGLVLGEALACGLPVISSKSPGGLAMVTPDLNGVLLDDPRDAPELARAIATVLSPDALPRLAAAARPSVAHLGWLDVARALVSLAAPQARW